MGHGVGTELGPEPPRVLPPADENDNVLDATIAARANSGGGSAAAPPPPFRGRAGLLHTQLGGESPLLGDPASDLESAADAFASAVGGRPDADEPLRIGSTTSRSGRPPPLSLAGDVLAAASATLEPGGRPLSTALRTRFERALGVQLGDVRVHANPAGRAALARLGARAATFGDAIIVADPAAVDDVELMAHEVAHTVQQRGGPPVLQRNGDGPDQREEQEYPPPARLVISDFEWARLQPAQPYAVLSPDLTPKFHFMAILIKAMTGDDYDRSYVEHVVSRLDAEARVYSSATRIRTEAEPDAEGAIVFDKPILIPVAQAGAVATFLARELDPSGERAMWDVLALDRQQVERLSVGIFAQQIIRALRVRLAEFDFPRWYTAEILFRQLHTMVGTLRESMDAMNAAPDRSARAAAEDDLVDRVYRQVHPLVLALDEVRICEPLFTEAGFRRFWRLDPTGSGGPGEEQVPVVSEAVSFLAFASTQSAIVNSIDNGSLETSGIDGDNRVELWNRFLRYQGRRPEASIADAADLALDDVTTDRNADPLPSEIQHVPPLRPETDYEASKDSIHRFMMDVEFADVFDHLANAFGGFIYRFEVLRVPSDDLDDQQQTLDDTKVGEGDAPSDLAVLGHELGRELDNIAADAQTIFGTRFDDEQAERTVVRRAIENMVRIAGAAGTGAATLFAANAILGLAGRLVGTLVSSFTRDAWETDVQFGNREPGLYIIRGTADPDLTGLDEYRRATSVAWTPIWVRTPDDVARRGVERSLDSRRALRDLLAEIERDLQTAPEGEERDTLLAQREVVLAALGGNAGDHLRAQIESYRSALARAEGLPDHERDAIRDEIEKFEGVLARRSARMGGRPGEILTATFVTDDGAVLTPLVEIDVVSSEEDSVTYRAYELSSGKDPHGTGTSRHADPVVRRQRAIRLAVEELFRRYNAFGRGQLGFFVPDQVGGVEGETLSIRIDADATAIAMETVENVTSALSVAALVAAPFTGGASLALMVPIGLVGAVPAGYRLIDAGMAGTLRFDTMETWLDVVDIVGAVTGPFGRVGSGTARTSRTGLRLVRRTAQGIAMIGAGADHLGLILVNIHTINQIEEIQRGPGTESQKRAQIMRVLGGALQANGMAAGQGLIARSVELAQLRQPHGADDIRPRVDTEERVATDRPDPARTDRVEGGAADPVTRTDGPERLPAPDAAAPRERVGDPPPESMGRTPVRVDPDDGSSSVKVTYRVDERGLVRDIEIVAGRAASAADVRAHARAVEHLQRYQGFAGQVRLALDRVLGFVGLAGEPPPGSLAFEAKGELLKLPDVIELRVRELAGAIERGDAAAARDVAADIANLQRQLDFYEQMFDAGRSADGRGYIAALDSESFTQMRQQLGDRAFANMRPSRQRRRRNPRQDRERAQRMRNELDATLDQLRTDRPGGLTAADLAAISDYLATPSDTRSGSTTPTEMGRRITHLENLAEQLRTRPDLVDPGTQSAMLASLRQLFTDVTNNYIEGRTNERDPRAVEPSRDIDAELVAVSEMIAVLDPTSMNPIEFLLGADAARRRLARTQERLRATGEPRFTADPEQVGGRRRATQAGLEHLDVESVSLTARGRVDEPLDRSLPEVGLERYVPAARELDRIGIEPPELAARLRELLDGYDRAHLIGPGFGSELFEGIWFAPSEFNRQTQNRGIELLVRSMQAAGWSVDLVVTARGDRITLPTADGPHTVTVLREITYELRWADDGGEVRPQDSQTARITYRLGEPPDRTVDVESTDLPQLGAGGIPTELLEGVGLGGPPGGARRGR